MQRFMSSLAAIVALVFVLLGTVSASAHTLIPATASCLSTGACLAKVVWGNGTTYPIQGAQTNMTISNPTLQKGSADWYRYLSIRNYVNNAEIIVGIEKVGSGNVYNYCSGANELFYFIETVTPSSITHTNCWQISNTSPDINHQATFKITRNADNSYEIYIDNYQHDSPCEGNCSEYNIQATVYHIIKMQENMYDTFSNTHEVWGSAWGYNQYQDPSTLNFYYQTNSSGTGSGGAVQMTAAKVPYAYWHIKPENSSTGGELYTCDYDPVPTSCTYGS